MLALLLLLIAGAAAAQDYDPAALSSADRALAEARLLMDKDRDKAAADLLEAANKRYPDNVPLLVARGQALYDTGRYGEAEIAYRRARRLNDSSLVQARLAEIRDKYDAFTRSLNAAVIEMQRNTDAGNYDTTIAIGTRAIAKFPNQDILYKEKGDAEYRKGELADAEVSLMKALQINPLNREARELVEEIRNTEQAQVSTEFAQWISIAKDKVGDFVVTFLALFAAFVVNSAIDPIILRIKLNNARRHFDQGNYDRFTDLIESMLDLENFGPLRANFRFMLRQKSYEEARAILDKYIMTIERLPTLLRILEREHEKMLEGGD